MFEARGCSIAPSFLVSVSHCSHFVVHLSNFSPHLVYTVYPLLHTNLQQSPKRNLQTHHRYDIGIKCSGMLQSPMEKNKKTISDWSACDEIESTSELIIIIPGRPGSFR